ncbi:MAG: S16 family serine protease [Angelakisella sp.]
METAVVPGTGKTITTGSLGVMKESVTAAITYIRSVAEHYEIENTFYKDKDIHIHFPEGAVPKDGPSAGITTCTALISALGNIPVRHDVAMTGEITLRGRVLAIGGLREKSMAAYKNGIKTVIIPAANEPDLAEIDDVVKKAIHFVPVHTMEEVLEQALVQLPGGAQKRSYHAAATEHKEASSAVLCR